MNQSKEYGQRIELFKSYGYDLVGAMDFIVDAAQPIQGRILEIGTGKGYFASALARKGYSFTTIDNAEDVQAIARKSLQEDGLQDQVKILTSDAENLDWPANSFDVCFGVNIVHHLSRPLRVMDEILRVNASGGKIVIADFNAKGFSIINEIHAGEGHHHDKGWCTLNEVAGYFQGRGFWVKWISSDCQDILIIHRTGV